MEDPRYISNELPKSIRQRPLYVKRGTTDITFTFIFGIIFVAWIGVCIYVFCARGTEEKNLKQYFISEKSDVLSRVPGFDISSIDYMISRGTDHFLIWSIGIGNTLLLCFLILLRHTPSFFAKLGFVFLYVIIVIHFLIIIGQLLCCFLHGHSVSKAMSVVIDSAIYSAFYGAIVFAMQKIGISPLTATIRKSFQALFYFRSLISVSLVTTAATIVITSLTFQALLRTSAFDDPFMYLITLGGVYFFSFALSLQNMIIAEVLANYHWWLDNQRVPTTVTVRQSILTICRYHFGSVALSATGVLPLILSLYIIVKYRFNGDRKYRNPYVEIVFKVYSLFNIARYAELFVAMHGYSYTQSLKISFDILWKNCFKCTALIGVFNNFVLGLGVTITFLIAFFLSYPIFQSFGDLPLKEMIGYLTVGSFICSLSSALLSPVIGVATGAFNTTLVCELQLDEECTDEIGKATCKSEKFIDAPVA